MKYEMTVDKNFSKLLSEIRDSKKNPANNDSEIIRRAVALYKYLHDQLEKEEGGKVAILDKNNTPKIIIDPLP